MHEACGCKSKEFTPFATARMDKAEEFYTRLFEQRPDDRPMDGLIQWRNVAGANFQTFHDKENAGSGKLAIVIPKKAGTVRPANSRLRA